MSSPIDINDSSKRVPVCKIGGQTMYGTQEEADACGIPAGARVEGIDRDGVEFSGTLELLLCYEEPMYEIRIDDGTLKLCVFGLGDHLWASSAVKPSPPASGLRSPACEPEVRP